MAVRRRDHVHAMKTRIQTRKTPLPVPVVHATRYTKRQWRNGLHLPLYSLIRRRLIRRLYRAWYRNDRSTIKWAELGFKRVDVP